MRRARYRTLPESSSANGRQVWRLRRVPMQPKPREAVRCPLEQCLVVVGQSDRAEGERLEVARAEEHLRVLLDLSPPPQRYKAVDARCAGRERRIATRFLLLQVQ